MDQFEPVTSLLNSEVVDGRGEFVGWLHEILIDSLSGRIGYGRLELDLGDGPNVSLIVPWSAFSPDRATPGRWRVAARAGTIRKLATRAPQRLRARSLSIHKH